MVHMFTEMELVNEIKRTEALVTELTVTFEQKPLPSEMENDRTISEMMKGSTTPHQEFRISRASYHRLQQTLLDCGDFETDDQLQAIFIDTRINLWAVKLPTSNNRADRVRRTITYLWSRKRVDTDENALVLLLRVLSERHHPTTSCHHNILGWAEAVERATAIQSEAPSTQPPTNQPKGSLIFINHSNQDKSYALQLAAELQQRGFTPWVADKNILPGQKWVKAIHQSLVGCAAMIVVMTPEANRSKWINRTISEAEVLKKPIIPLLLRGRRFFRLNDIQFDDVTDGSLPSEHFYDRLRLIIWQPEANSSNQPIDN